MSNEKESKVLLLRFHYQELITKARQLGFTVKAGSFEERERADDFGEVEVWAVLEVPE